MEIYIGGSYDYYDLTYENFFCLNHNGSLRWQYVAGNRIYYAPVIRDYNSDGNQDIALLSHFNDYPFSNYSTLFINSDRVLQWEIDYYLTELGEWLVDINNDNVFEIVYRDNKKIGCINYTGGLLWEKEFKESIERLIIFDCDNDSNNELLVIMNFEDLICLDFYTHRLWKYHIKHFSYQQRIPDISVIDFNSDGLQEFVFTYQDQNDYFYHIICIELSNKIVYFLAILPISLSLGLLVIVITIKKKWVQ